MRSCHAASLTLLLLSLACLANVRTAEARVQGVKGRRLQVFASLADYRGGTVFVEEPSVVVDRQKAVVQQLGLRWYVHQFLETRLRELPWTVEPWYDEFGPLEGEGIRGPALALSSVVSFESRLRSRRLVLEAFLRDQATGEVVARYTGYGRATVRRSWLGARDDLQEITRVMVGYLADELDGLVELHGALRLLSKLEGLVRS